MNYDDFLKMRGALSLAMEAHPNCRIANCDCDSVHGEWKPECYCMCHFFYMDERFGKDQWTLNKFSRIAKKGVAKPRMVGDKQGG